MFKMTSTLASILISFALTGCAAEADDESTDGTEGSSALERGRVAGDTSAADERRDDPDTRRDNDLPNLRRYHAARIQAARRAAAANDDERSPDRTPDRGDRTPERDADRPATVTRRNADDTRR